LALQWDRDRRFAERPVRSQFTTRQATPYRFRRHVPSGYFGPHWLEKSFWLQPSFCREDLMRQPSFNSSTFSNEAAMGFKSRMKAMTGLSADSS